MQTLYALVQLRSNRQLENESLHYNHDLEAKWVKVMNTKVVPCDILNMFKVLLRSHNILYIDLDALKSVHGTSLVGFLT